MLKLVIFFNYVVGVPVAPISAQRACQVRVVVGGVFTRLRSTVGRHVLRNDYIFPDPPRHL